MIHSFLYYLEKKEETIMIHLILILKKILVSFYFQWETQYAAQISFHSF
jgi:hypothetical protein